MQYLDYTSLVNHRERMWNIEGTSLAKLGGLDIPALFTALGLAIPATVIVGAVFLLLGIPLPFLFIALPAIAVVLYSLFTRETVKNTPKELLLRFVARTAQPKRYISGMDAGNQPTEMTWQVILWRPEWANIRIGSPRRYTSYDPAPISEENRSIIDPTDAGELMGWKRFISVEDERNMA
ncbi:hypothetical protein [Corynebacterium crudilactis]|uniref:Uncharacterized protein n=1 Tax=Corynebacterium crudilactis TaxID=1652495 RepID=A0A172QY16_9CORY|nr:hypothetical protein [Corynebacterium crudilactis]ANE05536.1 hypothetical protein ccrud_14440 [Corynebacterium crudilactis]